MNEKAGTDPHKTMPMRMIFQSATYRVEHHAADVHRKARSVVCTFTPYGFRDLDKPGFGVAFLQKLGFDVIAFKSARDRWFQDMPDEILPKVRSECLAGRYDTIMTYGSSMGGFAALACADALGAQRVIAMSPQFTIKEAYDTRWAANAKGLKWNRPIDTAAVGNADVHVVYDDRSPLEMSHITRLQAIVPSGRLHEIRLPFSGHPSLAYLRQVGSVSSFVRQLLIAPHDMHCIDTWSDRRHSANFYMALSAHLESREKTGSAIWAMQQAQNIAPGNAIVMHQFALLLERAGRIDDAIVQAVKATQTGVSNPGYRQHLGMLMYRSGRYAEAVSALTEALRLSPHNGDFRYKLNAAQDALSGMTVAKGAMRGKQSLETGFPGFARRLVNFLTVR